MALASARWPGAVDLVAVEAPELKGRCVATYTLKSSVLHSGHPKDIDVKFG